MSSVAHPNIVRPLSFSDHKQTGECGCLVDIPCHNYRCTVLLLYTMKGRDP